MQYSRDGQEFLMLLFTLLERVLATFDCLLAQNVVQNVFCGTFSYVIKWAFTCPIWFRLSVWEIIFQDAYWIWTKESRSFFSQLYATVHMWRMCTISEIWMSGGMTKHVGPFCSMKVLQVWASVRCIKGGCGLVWVGVEREGSFQSPGEFEWLFKWGRAARWKSVALWGLSNAHWCYPLHKAPFSSSCLKFPAQALCVQCKGLTNSYFHC